MHFKKNIIVTIVLLISLSIFFTGAIWIYTRSTWHADKAVRNFVRQIELGNVNDIKLTIYYALPASGQERVTVKDLIREVHHYKIVVEGTELAEYIDTLKQLKDINLVSVKSRTRINAGVYYVFEDRNNRKLLDVAMFGRGGGGDGFGSLSIFVNGNEVEWDDKFIEIMLPFLPESRVEGWMRTLEQRSVER